MEKPGQMQTRGAAAAIHEAPHQGVDPHSAPLQVMTQPAAPVAHQRSFFQARWGEGTGSAVGEPRITSGHSRNEQPSVVGRCSGLICLMQFNHNQGIAVPALCSPSLLHTLGSIQPGLKCEQGSRSPSSSSPSWAQTPIYGTSHSSAPDTLSPGIPWSNHTPPHRPRFASGEHPVVDLCHQHQRELCICQQLAAQQQPAQQQTRLSRHPEQCGQ
jgi:hypothetical protein